LHRELLHHCEIVQSSDTFWEMAGDFEIVHLHFPEYLTYDIERAYIDGLTPELIDEVKDRLEFWSRRCKIIVTRHNAIPHNAPTDELWAQMYRTVYSYADAVVHLANWSVGDFCDRYSSLWESGTQAPRHAVIPIHNYASLPNTSTRAQSRKKLGIPLDAQVMLVFGAIRNDAERALVLESFNGARVERKVLLVSRWRETLSDVSWIRLKYWLRDLKRAYHRLHRRHYFHYEFVEDDDTQFYLNAADILFIPRIDALNSANVSLGFTFGRVVVGPSGSNPGELLKNAGNPVFDPRDPNAAARAVEQGFRLARSTSLGAQNQLTAMEQWDVARCASKYAAVYAETLGNDISKVEAILRNQPADN
jgi:hypothetical protein